MIAGIISFAVGILLIGFEILLPGFGLPGISGIIGVLLGGFFFINALGLAGGLALSAVVLIFFGLLLFVLMKMAANGKIPSVKFRLSEKDLEKDSFSSVKEIQAGSQGIAVSDLRPAGIAEIEGKRISVVTEGGYIASGERIMVSAVNGLRIVVCAA